MRVFEQGDRVIVTDLRTGTRHSGTIYAIGPRLTVEYDDGLLVKVHRSFVHHEEPREPTDKQIYGAGCEDVRDVFPSQARRPLLPVSGTKGWGRMMRASYRNGIDWIAQNDEPDTLDPDEVSGYISTLLLADLFGKDPLEVARAVVRRRNLLAKDQLHHGDAYGAERRWGA